MRRIHSLRQAWSVRLVGSICFAVGAAALTHAVGDMGSGKLPGRDIPPEVGQAFTGDATLLAPPGMALGPGGMRTLEGTTIIVSAGWWTPLDIYKKLRENGLDPTIGAHLTVRVQAAYPPTRITMRTVIDRASRRPVLQATLWLDAWPGWDFRGAPDRTIAHAIGLLWIAHYIQDESFWDRYLELRRLAGDRRLGSSRVWKREEILADDYRLLFGSEAAIAQLSRHMNAALSDPRSVSGLRDFLIGTAR